MQEREMNETQEKLLDLGPGDLERTTPQALRAELVDAGVSPAAAALEINYLRQVSRRRVKLPPETYFADTRRKILARVDIHPRSFWDRISSILLPTYWKPIPATAAALVIAIAILTPMMYHHAPTRIVDLPALESAGPYVSMTEVYAEHVTAVDQPVLSAEELREYADILLMSTAILGSPSSLSRSRSLAGSPN